MKAHEVRLLCRCPVCGKLGDEQAMIKVGPMKTPAHDRCAFEQLGLGVVNLPKERACEIHLGCSRTCGDAAAQRRQLDDGPIYHRRPHLGPPRQPLTRRKISSSTTAPTKALMTKATIPAVVRRSFIQPLPHTGSRRRVLRPALPA
jgi:hypothetical protein